MLRLRTKCSKLDHLQEQEKVVNDSNGLASLNLGFGAGLNSIRIWAFSTSRFQWFTVFTLFLLFQNCRTSFGAERAMSSHVPARAKY